MRLERKHRIFTLSLSLSSFFLEQHDEGSPCGQMFEALSFSTREDFFSFFFFLFYSHGRQFLLCDKPGSCSHLFFSFFLFFSCDAVGYEILTGSRNVMIRQKGKRGNKIMAVRDLMYWVSTGDLGRTNRMNVF